MASTVMREYDRAPPRAVVFVERFLGTLTPPKIFFFNLFVIVLFLSRYGGEWWSLFLLAFLVYGYKVALIRRASVYYRLQYLDLARTAALSIANCYEKKAIKSSCFFSAATLTLLKGESLHAKELLDLVDFDALKNTKMAAQLPFSRARILMEAGFFEEAETLLRSTPDLRASWPRQHSLALLSCLRGDLPGARKFLSEVIPPDSSSEFRGLWCASAASLELRVEGDAEQARALAEESLTWDPKSVMSEAISLQARAACGVHSRADTERLVEIVLDPRVWVTESQRAFLCFSALKMGRRDGATPREGELLAKLRGSRHGALFLDRLR